MTPIGGPFRRRGVSGNAYPWLHNWQERREARRIQIVTMASINAQLARHRETMLRTIPAVVAAMARPSEAPPPND